MTLVKLGSLSLIMAALSFQPLVVLAKPLTQPEQWQNDLVDWLVSKPNGYFSDKILWTKTEMGYNMHAAQDIPKGSDLMIIPNPSAIINSDGTGEECMTIVKMMQEYEKGQSSAYYPYIRYLFGGHEGGTSTGLLPSAWSQEGQELLTTLVGDELAPRDFEKHQEDVLDICADYIPKSDMDAATKQRWQDAYIFWLSRSWTDKMVPILDMINHRNGKWLNVESTTAHTPNKDIRVYALRDIVKGEQLWNTYNECLDTDCDGGRIKYTYITPHILMDYGFVEGYPRRFMFHVDQHGRKYNPDEFLVVEIDQFDNDSEDEIKLEWHYATPTQAQVEWIQQQLQRLQNMETKIKNGLSQLTSSHETHTIETYYNAYKEAFQLALKHKNDAISQRTTIFPEDEEEEEDEDELGYEL